MNRRNPLAVISAARTPMAKAFTLLSDATAVELGCCAVDSAISRASAMHDHFDKRQIDEVIIGNVAGPPDAANVARVIALMSGIDQHRIAHTVNRNCASGMESIIAGWQAIESGRSTVVVAGGTESMSKIPLLYSSEATKRWLKLSRSKTLIDRLRVLASFRMKHFKPVLGVQLGLTDPVSGLNMGQTAEVLAKEFSISRREQDQFALQSHQKAAQARRECFLSGEIEPFLVGNERTVSKDNGPRDEQSIEQLGKLRPIFASDGTVTPGNSCPLTDGAAAMVLTDAETAKQFASPLGYIMDYQIAGCDPTRMGLGPVYATAKLLVRNRMKMSDFDLVELNEAFAAQSIACLRAADCKAFAHSELGQSRELGEIPVGKLNVNGGAIALGHPVGMTGTRLVMTLLRSLRQRGLHRGLATLCVGGGQGVSMIVQTDLEG